MKTLHAKFRYQHADKHLLFDILQGNEATSGSNGKITTEAHLISAMHTYGEYNSAATAAH